VDDIPEIISFDLFLVGEGCTFCWVKKTKLVDVL